MRRRTDQAYTDKLDGKIDESYWQRKRADWQREEPEIEAALSQAENCHPAARLLDVKRILESRKQGVFSLSYAETSRTSRTAQKGTLELRD